MVRTTKNEQNPKNRPVVLIPTLNEAEAVGLTVDDVLEHVPDCLVLVIDSYSDDGTADIARSRGAIVVNAPRGGKGLAMRFALPKIMAQYPSENYVMLDGDFTYPAKHILDVVLALDSRADVVIGYRAKREQGAMTTTNLIGNWGLSALASVLYGVRVRDVCSGLWGFRRKALERFVLTSKGFTLEADLFANTVRCGCRLVQIPIEYRARPKRSTAKLKVSDGLKIAEFLIMKRLSASPSSRPFQFPL